MKDTKLYRTIFNHLPVGLEIYDCNGCLIEINSRELQAMGIPNKQDIMGFRLFDSPYLPSDARLKLLAGEDVQFVTHYDFDDTNRTDCYTPIYSGKCLFDISITILRSDNEGSVEGYMVTSQDITKIVNKEEELRQSKQKIEVATANADLVLWEFDVYHQLFFSEKDPVTGYDSTNGMNVEEAINLFYPDDLKMIAEPIKRMLAGEDFSFTLDLRMFYPGDNEIQYCTFRGTPYERDANGKVIRFVGSRKNNTEIQRRRILQDNILNNFPFPIQIKNIEGNAQYVFCNKESEHMFGSRIGGFISDIMDEKQAVRIEKTDREVFATGTPYYGSERIELKDGRSYDMLVNKSIIYDGNKRLLLNVRWDQSLQNDLKRRAKVLSLSMQAMNAYTWFYDPEENRVSFGEGFDRPERDTLQLNSREKYAAHIHPDERQLFIDSQVEQLQKESADWSVEYRIDLEGNGVYEWWETHGIIETTIIDDVPHKFMLGMSVCIDSHKKIELELREAKALAEQSDKLKSTFLANMSHEIRTPLNAIIGFSDLLMEAEVQEDREEYMRIIHTNNELLLKLIGDILDLSKLESGMVELKYEEFNLADHFADMSTSMKQRVTNPEVELIAHNPYRQCKVRLDRNRITQIMMNYVTNAIKYTPKGVIEMGYEVLDEGIRLYVQDTGIGIPDEKKPKVFHRFEKLDEFAQGTGLGLSICKAIAESMGGSVGFKSSYGRGSEFWAVLPCQTKILEDAPARLHRNESTL